MLCQRGVLPVLEPPSLTTALGWCFPALCAAVWHQGANGGLSLVLHHGVEPERVCLSAPVLHHTTQSVSPLSFTVHRATRAVCPSVPLLP